MKKIITIITIIMLVIVLSALSYAAPGVPHQFYGNVYVNSNPAADGLLITAQIDGVEVAATSVNNAQYGYMPYKFYIQDPNNNRDGKKIMFYVDGIKSAEYTFSNGLSTSLDLSITKTVTTTTTTSTSSGGGGGGSGGGTLPTPKNTTNTSSSNTTTVQSQSVCTPNWECSKWLDCTNMAQKRVCVDKNNCETFQGKPEEQRICEDEKQLTALANSVNQNPNDANKGFFEKITGRVIGGGATSSIVFAILAIIAVAAVLGLLYFMFRKKDYLY